MLRDQVYRWVVVAYTIALQAATLGTIVYSFALFAPPWLGAFEASRAEVMLTISLLQLSLGLVSPFAGALMDRLRMRTVVLCGCVCFAAGWIAVHFATALWQLWLIYVLLFPLAMSTMGTLAAQTLVTRWFVTGRGLAIGVSAIGTNVGGVVVPLLVAGALAQGAWREVALWMCLGGLAVVVPLTWLVLARRAPGERSVAAGGPRASAIDILRSRTFWVAAGALLPLNLTFGAVQFNLGVLAADLGYAERGGWLIALCSLCMIGGKVLFGALADWLDHRALHWIAVAAMITAMLLLQGAPEWWLLVTAVVFVGLAGGSLLPVMGVVVGARYDLASFGRAMGLMMLTLSVAALGPLLAGWVFDASGGYDLAFQVFAIAMAAGAVCMWWLPPPAVRSG